MTLTIANAVNIRIDVVRPVKVRNTKIHALADTKGAKDVQIHIGQDAD
jgi:hypothetical protein